MNSDWMTRGTEAAVGGGFGRITVEDFASWRDAARRLRSSDVPPENVQWIDRRDPAATSQTLMFNDAAQDLAACESSSATASAFQVPTRFLDLAKTLAFHRSPKRWPLLYRILWRLTRDDPQLMDNPADADLAEALQMEKAVRRDAHKMQAFVRFRQTQHEQGLLYVAWHRPDHFVLRMTADFFVRRFDVMRWMILTPDESAAWDGKQLTFGPGAPRAAAPSADQLEELWKTYYASIFNPARLKVGAMRAEMPLRHWPTLPEAELIGPLIRTAPRRVEEMIRKTEGVAGAASFVAEAQRQAPDLASLAAALQHCRGCDLYRDATQAVFGQGPPSARLVLVGEQPGDQEDRAGAPFVGPAGQLLREVMDEVGIDARATYITNAVKHFKFRPDGGRRLHVKPSSREIGACRPWLEAELAVIAPAVIVCLGTTAAGAVLGPGFRITADRGKVMPCRFAGRALATYHPSAILRVPDDVARQRMRGDLRRDLQAAAALLE